MGGTKMKFTRRIMLASTIALGLSEWVERCSIGC